VDRLRADPPSNLGPLRVTDLEDLSVGRRLPATDAVILHCDLGRVVLRPSGTEPKLKAYAEIVLDATPATVTAQRAAASGLVDEVLTALAEALGFPPSPT
jgi:phosphomannomutase